MPLRRINIAPPPLPTSFIVNKPTFVINKTADENEIADLLNITAELGDTAITKTNKTYVYTTEGWKQLTFDLEL